MTVRAPGATLVLVREALEAGDSCSEVTLRLGAAPALVRAVMNHLLGQGPEPDPCSWCGGAGTIALDQISSERCPHCRGLGFTSPEA